MYELRIRYKMEGNDKIELDDKPSTLDIEKLLKEFVEKKLKGKIEFELWWTYGENRLAKKGVARVYGTSVWFEEIRYKCLGKWEKMKFVKLGELGKVKR